MYKWPNICREINIKLQQVSSINYESFYRLIQRTINNYSTAQVKSEKRLLAWWNSRCSNLRKQKIFFLKKARALVSCDYWIQYKRTSANFRQVIKESKQYFWDSVRREAKDSRILHRVFRKISTRSSSPMDAHLFLQVDDKICSDAVIHTEAVADHFSGECVHEPTPFTYGSDIDSQINSLFTFIELKDAIRRTKISTPGDT